MVCGLFGDLCYGVVYHVGAVLVSDVEGVTTQRHLTEDVPVVVQQFKEVPVTISHAQVYNHHLQFVHL